MEDYLFDTLSQAANVLLYVNKGGPRGWIDRSDQDKSVKLILAETPVNDRNLQIGQTSELNPRFEEAQPDQGFYEPKDVTETVDRIYVSIKQRQGQPEFRQSLIQAYGGRCAITDCDVAQVLEACHIRPYDGPNSNDLSDGILLRADLHTLFDRGLIGIDSHASTVIVAQSLLHSDYKGIHRKKFNLPNDLEERPSTQSSLERQG